MADDKDATVVVAEDGVVTVDLADVPEIEAAPVVEPKPADPPKQPRQRTPAAADEAAAALTQAVKTAEAEATARKAAEATAAAERRAAEEARRIAAQREQEAKGYKEQAENSQLTILDSGIERATNDIASYTAELERALEAGEFAKVAATQAKLGKATATLDRLESEKSSYEARKTATPTTEGRVEAAPQQSAFEQYVSGFAPVAQQWLRAHPECVPDSVGGNATSNAKMMAGHYAAKAKGLPEGTTEYFNVIEEHTGHRTPVSAAAAVVEAGDPTPKPAPRQPQRQPAPSAPVSREPPAANGSAPTQQTVRLTKEQQEIALISSAPRPGETDAQFRQRAFSTYAVEFLRAQAEGRIGRMTH